MSEEQPDEEVISHILVFCSLRGLGVVIDLVQLSSCCSESSSCDLYAGSRINGYYTIIASVLISIGTIIFYVNLTTGTRNVSSGASVKKGD